MYGDLDPIETPAQRKSREKKENTRKLKRTNEEALDEAKKFLARQPATVRKEVKKILADLPEGYNLDDVDLDVASLAPGMAFAKMIRLATKDGRDMLKLWLRLMMDENQDLSLRMQAANQLADRGFGKAPVEVQHNVDVRHHFISTRLAGLSDEELAELDNPIDLVKYVDVTAEEVDE
jgi:hypothetical protein